MFVSLFIAFSFIFAAHLLVSSLRYGHIEDDFFPSEDEHMLAFTLDRLSQVEELLDDGKVTDAQLAIREFYSDNGSFESFVTSSNVTLGSDHVDGDADECPRCRVEELYGMR